MMSESQALETLSREDPEAAGDARAALAWLTGDEGLETSRCCACRNSSGTRSR
jgi:hypothetical protein